MWMPSQPKPQLNAPTGIAVDNTLTKCYPVRNLPLSSKWNELYMCAQKQDDNYQLQYLSSTLYESAVKLTNYSINAVLIRFKSFSISISPLSRASHAALHILPYLYKSPIHGRARAKLLKSSQSITRVNKEHLCTLKWLYDCLSLIQIVLVC